MNWKLFFEGLAAAAASGAATSLTTAAAGGSLKAAGATAGAGAIMGVLAYLKKPSFNPPTPPAQQ